MNTQTQTLVAGNPATHKITKPNSFLSLLRLVSNESLTRCMNRLVLEENYELAMVYRDELVRRRVGGFTC